MLAIGEEGVMGETRSGVRRTTAGLVALALMVTVATSKVQDETQALGAIPETDVGGEGVVIPIAFHSDSDEGRSDRELTVVLTATGAAMVAELLDAEGAVMATAPVASGGREAVLTADEPCEGASCSASVELRLRPVDAVLEGSVSGEVTATFTSDGEDPPPVDVVVGAAEMLADGAETTVLGAPETLSVTAGSAIAGQRVSLPRSACDDRIWLQHWPAESGAFAVQVVTASGPTFVLNGTSSELTGLCNSDHVEFWVVAEDPAAEALEVSWSLVGSPGVGEATVVDADLSSTAGQEVEVGEKPTKLPPQPLPQGAASLHLAGVTYAATGELATDVRVGGSSAADSGLGGFAVPVAGPCPEVTCPAEVAVDVRRVGLSEPGGDSAVVVRLYHLVVPG